MWVREVEFDSNGNPVRFILRIPKTKTFHCFATIEGFISFFESDEAPNPAYVAETDSWMEYERWLKNEIEN